MAILLYGTEVWRIAATDMNSLAAFQRNDRKCMRKIVFWPNQVSNEELYRRTLSLSVKLRIQRLRHVPGRKKKRQNCTDLNISVYYLK